MTLVALMGRQEVPNHLPRRNVTKVTARGRFFGALVFVQVTAKRESRRSVAPTGGW